MQLFRFRVLGTLPHSRGTIFYVGWLSCRVTPLRHPLNDLPPAPRPLWFTPLPLLEPIATPAQPIPPSWLQYSAGGLGTDLLRADTWGTVQGVHGTGTVSKGHTEHGNVGLVQWPRSIGTIPIWLLGVVVLWVSTLQRLCVRLHRVLTLRATSTLQVVYRKSKSKGGGIMERNRKNLLEAEEINMSSSLPYSNAPMSKTYLSYGGAPGPDPLRRPPPPPSSLVFGWEVPDHQRRRRLKEILLEPLEGQKMGFQPMCLYSKYSVFSGERNNG